MKGPVQIERYIRLVVEKPLKKEEAKNWFNIVKEAGPQDIVSSVKVLSPKKTPENVSLVHKTTKSGKHYYDVPLKRDLLDKEVGEIAQTWNAYFPKGDFEIETSLVDAKDLDKSLDQGIALSDNEYKEFAEELAKTQHQDWYKERSDAGWRYGQEVDHGAKTHPMMRPWEQLPDKYKKIDYNAPEKFLEILERLGYVVVAKDDFNRMVSSFGLGTKELPQDVEYEEEIATVVEPEEEEKEKETNKDKKTDNEENFDDLFASDSEENLFDI